MQILDGKLVASKIKEEIQKEVDKLKKNKKRLPTLATILVGENPASLTYVASKHKTAASLGFLTKDFKLDKDTEEEKLIKLIEDLNKDKEVDAILVQLPLPKHIDTSKVLSKIDKNKDADGISYENIARLALSEEGVVPCTPYGILELLKYYNIQLSGKHIVVIGRSRIVGRPLSLLLNNTENNATVTVCNSKTENLKELTKIADIVIPAMGVPFFLTADYIKKGAVIVDVGISRVDDNSPKGYSIKGDVDAKSVEKKAGFVSPVPGGVGPLTIASLMKNTLLLYKKHEMNRESTN